MRGFTLVELLIAITIIVILAAVSSAVYGKIQMQAKSMRSMANLRQLALANLAYSGDNQGEFCPAQDKRNKKRWHGERGSSSEKFDAARGYLAPYLGEDGRVKTCPLLEDVMSKEEGSWEAGTGGYGYNAAYIGGSYATTGRFYIPESVANVPHPTRTVMFTTSAYGRDSRVQEYPYSEPYFSVNKGGGYGGGLQPSTHFRANGKALVAWCDGHTSAESPSEELDGDDGDAALIGWFGPREQNGYWNPRADRSVFR